MASPSTRRLSNLCAAAFLAATALPAVQAATTDIASSPLANRRSSDIKPNIMMILDDSGSMTYDAMPDGSANYNRFGPGRRNYLCNTIYYNPTPTSASVNLSPYLIPRTDTGANLNAADPATFNNAYDNGYWAFDQVGQTAGVAQRVNLATDQHYGAAYPLSSYGQAAYYWTYLGTVAVTPTSGVCATAGTDTSNFATATGLCGVNAADDSGTYTVLTSAYAAAAEAAAAAAGDAAARAAAETAAATAGDAACAATGTGKPKLIWRKKLVNATSSTIFGFDETQRYANWYSYYRNRLQAMKSSVGRAFLPLIAKKKYRVGFITISPQVLRDGTPQASVYAYNAAAPYDSKFLEVANFDTLSGTHPNKWFNILYAQQPNGQTPLREGLSRVGRYFAGKNDGPNAGMIPSSALDPVQYACQQNFSILTTDGYWNSPGGSIGGYKLVYTDVMDNQDGDIAEVSTPLDKDGHSQGLAIGARPIYDGTISQSGTIWDARNRYSLANCTWYYKSTNQALRYQTVINRTTAQTNKTDSQVAQSTAQTRQTTYRTQRQDKQLKMSTEQNQQETWEIRKSTLQVVKNTTQNTASIWAVTRMKFQDYQTSDVVKTTAWQLETRSRTATKTTTQHKQTTSLTQKTQIIYSMATSSPRQTQSQNLRTSVQAKQSTDQWVECNGAGFDCQPAASCTAVPEVRTCVHNVTTDVPIQTCTPQTAAAGNNWITKTCSYPAATNYSNVGVQTCTPQTAAVGNDWVELTCATNNFTNQPVNSCTAQTGAAGNAWLTISCPAAVTTGPGNVDPATSCAIAGANGTCTVAGTSPTWIHTTYTKTTTITGSSASCTAAAAVVGNSWTATSCFNWSSAANTPVNAACVPTAVGGQSRATFTAPTGLGYPGGHNTSNPVWEDTTCAANPVVSVRVKDDGSMCTNQTAAAGNAYTGIACANSGYTGYAAHTGAASCNGGAVGSVVDDYGSDADGDGADAGDWLHVQCRKTDKTPGTAPSSCAAQTAALANSWYERICATGQAYNNTNQIAGPCPTTGYATGAKTGFTGPGGYSGPTGTVYVTTTCNNNVVTEASNPRPPASCGCNSEAFDMVTPQSCTVNASAGNSWTRTVCTRTFVSNTPIATCVAGVSGASPYHETTCPAATVTGPTPVASYMLGCNCDPGAGTTCTDPATAGNSYTASTCTGTTTGPTAVQTCIGADNPPPNTGTATDPTSGTPTVTRAATVGNAWTSTTCTWNQTAALGYVSACSNPPFTSTVTGNTTSTLYNAGNTTWYRCTRTTTGDYYPSSPGPVVWVNPNTPVASCGCTPGVNGSCAIPNSGTAGVNYLNTRCADLTTWSTPSSCAGQVILADAGNNWKESTCSNAIYNNGTAINDIPVQTCPSTSGTGALPSAGSYSTNFGGGIYGGTNGAGSSAYYYTTTCALTTTNNGVGDPATCGCTVSADNGSCATTPTAGNSWTTTTCNKTSVLTPVQSGTCTPVAASAGNTWTQTTCPVTTNGPTAGDPANCCTPGTNATCSVPGSNPSTLVGVPVWADTVCADVTSGPTPIGTCVVDLVADGASTPAWSTTACDTTSSPLNTSNVPAQTCTNVNGAAAVGPDFVTTTCTPEPLGKKIRYETGTQQTVVDFSGGVIVNSTPGAWSAYSAPADFGQCLGTDAATWPTAPADGRPAATDLTNPSLASISAGCTATGWPCTAISGGVSGGSTNSLADVAQYYYKTDLRPAGATGFNGLDVSSNIVFTTAGGDTTEGDMGKWQHMTTFTMGLGVSGEIAYNKNYKDKPIGSFMAAAGLNPVTGQTDAPAGTPLEPFQLIRCQDSANASLPASTTCLNWPIPAPNTAAAVDDLWHAAVNGRGQYFSAADPDAVFTGLQTALLAINAQSGAGTGATTSTQDPVPGNDLTFRAGFRTVDWTGDIRAQQLYTGTNLALEGTVLPGIVWSTQNLLDGKVGALCDNRTIHLLRKGATNNMVPFTWNTKACDGSGTPVGVATTGINAGEQTYFTSTTGSPDYELPFPMRDWSQFIDMTDGTAATIDQRPLAQGANLVNFLRGQRGMEDFLGGSATRLFRKRIHVLGDIVGSQPRYVTAPNANFTDTGYSLYKTAKAGRPAMLYAGANDGMLHAFKVGTSVTDIEGGTEAWAVIPSTMLPNLYRLADAGYSEAHTFFVDSTPSTGDVYDKYHMVSTPGDCNGATDPTVARDCWKTIIAGGFGAGGRGYYAMDVTDPVNPKALWEFKWSDTCYDSSNAATHYADCHLGLTFGAPLITKLIDHNWVVLVSSGLNNTNSPVKAGDGKGYLYVLDAITGKILKKISTGVGSGASETAALTGTLTLDSTSAVTGSGTAFTTELFPGQTITVNGQARVVHTVSDATHLTVTTAFTTSGTYGGTVVRTGPSGFAYLNAYVENYIQDNTTERVYGGDMLGNVWRIELKGLADSTDEAVRLATLVDNSGNPQPITTTPQLMNVGANQTRMVFVGTGRYLGESDLSDTQTQTVYGLAENLNLHNASPAYISNGSTVLPSAGLTLRQQLNPITMTTVFKALPDPITGLPVPDYRTSATSGCSAAAAAAGIACAGWYADLPDTGERVNLDMRLVLGSLIVPTNVTNLTACDSGGNSWLNVFDAATGLEVPGSAYRAGKYMPGAVTVGISLIRGQSGRILSILTKSDDTQQVSEVQTQQAAPLGRRSGWRDLLN
jgi:Tfp pilus tip-associated adhesin PilY1